MQYVIIGVLLLIIIIQKVNQSKNKEKLEKEIREQYIQEKRKETKEKIDAEKATMEQELAFYRQTIAARKNTLDAELAMSEAAAREKQSSMTALIEQRKQELDNLIEQLELRKKEIKEAYETNLNTELEKINAEIAGVKALKLEQMTNALAAEETKARAELAGRIAQFKADCEEKQMQYAADLKNIEEQLADYKKKQAAFNEEILRRRAIEEQQDFYRIVLPQAAIDDIQLLLTIRENLKQRENLDKLIYEAYISKPTQEMVKRVLEGRAPSGIYKITRLKTGEIYIGKSTDIKKRWGEHSKTAYGVGTIAHSTLHTTIKKDGIQNFTFELLEEVPKDKLTEREKYWITFYDSKNYGLNERNG